MQGNFSWSQYVGRWLGVPVRLHVSLLLFIGFIFCIQWHSEASTYTGVATVVALLISILVHEIAHIFAATNLGGSPCQVVFTPWGGNSVLTMPSALRSQGIIFAAGIFANGMLFVLIATLLVQLNHADIGELVNPFDPNAIEADWRISFLRILCWTNFQLFIVNLLPVAPFDGSQLVRTFIFGNNPALSREKLETSVMVVGHLTTLILVVVAVFSYNYNVGPVQPTWFVLVSAAIILYFNSRYEFYRRMSLVRQWNTNEVDEFDEFEEYDSVYDGELDDLFSYDDEETESISQWLREKQEDRERIEREIEKEEERRVDSILEQLHRSGIESLSEEDRALLQRVSDRYRRRRRHSTSSAHIPC